MAPLETAIKNLRLALASDSSAADWRWTLRRRLAEVREALADPEARAADTWLAAREGCSNRRRRQLQARVGAMAAGVLDRLDIEVIRAELGRLQVDLEHHLQRVHDLLYDSVSLELGGSE